MTDRQRQLEEFFDFVRLRWPEIKDSGYDPIDAIADGVSRFFPDCEVNRVEKKLGG